MEATNNSNQPIHLSNGIVNEDEISFTQIFSMVRKNVWLLIACAVVGFVLASVAAVMKHPVYQSSALLQVMTKYLAKVY